ncbi:MAG: hypothetical protein ACRENP_13535 [Longimicrobiales bacterium]
MKRILRLALLCAACALGARPVAAQMTQADSAAVLLGVAQRLGAEGRTTLAQSLLELIVERYGRTPAAAEAARLRGELRQHPEERSGKTELLVWTTTYGLALGALVPAAFEVDDAGMYGVGLIAGGPTGYFLGRSILRGRPISEGQARAISFGTLWGAWQGFGWVEALDIGSSEFDSSASGQALVRGILVGSLAGFGLGAGLSKKPIPAGTASAVSWGALWGTWYGAIGSALIDQDNESDLTTALIAGNVVLITSAILAPRWKMSRGRARLISITGIAGILTGAGVLLIAEPEDDDLILGTLVGSSALGLILGTYWTRSYDERQTTPGPSPGDEALLDLQRGKWTVNMPHPSLRMIEAREGSRPVYRPALAVPLLKASFR